MPDPHAPRPVLTLEQTARRLGACRWVEARLFEVVGGWVPSEDDVDAKLRFAIDSRRHAWRADLLAARLPETPHVAPAIVTTAPSPSAAAALDALAGAADTVARLVGLARVVLPSLLSAYDAHLEVASSVTDASTVRALRIVVADEVHQLQELEDLLGTRLGGSPHAPGEGTRGTLAALVAAGGGLVPAPEPSLV